MIYLLQVSIFSIEFCINSYHWKPYICIWSSQSGSPAVTQTKSHNVFVCFVFLNNKLSQKSKQIHHENHNYIIQAIPHVKLTKHSFFPILLTFTLHTSILTSNVQDDKQYKLYLHYVHVDEEIYIIHVIIKLFKLRVKAF